MTTAGLITLAEAAMRYGKPRGTLGRWHYLGWLTPCGKAPGHGGPFLYHEGEIETLIASVRRPGRPPKLPSPTP